MCFLVVEDGLCPDFVAFFVEVKTVGSKLLAKDIGSGILEEREEIDKLNTFFLSQLSQTGIYFGDLISLAVEVFVAMEAFVDRQQALKNNLGGRTFGLNTVEKARHASHNFVGRQVVANVVNSTE